MENISTSIGDRVRIAKHENIEFPITNHLSCSTRYFLGDFWKAYFDELYAESAERPGYVPFTMHPYIIGRPGRTLALRGIIQHMKKAGNLWFPIGIELAEWCLNDVFQAECQKLRASAG